MKAHDEHKHQHCQNSPSATERKDHDEVPAGFDGPVYTCPMHPEVRRTQPGSCPLCGMGLEAESGAGEEDQRELKDMTRRFWLGALFTVPLAIYAMGELIPGQPFDGLVSPGIGQWIQLLLATPVVLYSGWPFFVRGVQSERTMNLNMFTLIGLGVAVAYGFSVVATLLPDLFPASFRHRSGMRMVASASISRRRP